MYRVAARRWSQLENLRTPRHGVGVAALGGRVFVIGGGTEPGLTVSTRRTSRSRSRASPSQATGSEARLRKSGIGRQ